MTYSTGMGQKNGWKNVRTKRTMRTNSPHESAQKAQKAQKAPFSGGPAFLTDPLGKRGLPVARSLFLTDDGCPISAR
jgi:hypothetical protein